MFKKPKNPRKPHKPQYKPPDDTPVGTAPKIPNDLTRESPPAPPPARFERTMTVDLTSVVDVVNGGRFAVQGERRQLEPVTARELARMLLMRVDSEGAYSNIALDNALSRIRLPERDKAFATALFYGVLERRMTLDHIIRQYSDREFDSIDPQTKTVLRMGLYQILYMDSVPDSAAVNESNNLSAVDAKGFVNAVLRAFLRNGKDINLRQLKDLDARYSVEYSCARWIVKKWLAEYGESATHAMLAGSFGRPPLYIRVNTFKFSPQQVADALWDEGIEVKQNALLPECLEIGKGSGIEKTTAFLRGMFHVQDISSQLFCKAARPMMTETVIDVCSAPGGKAFTFAEIMNNHGRLFACEIYDGRLQLVTTGARRLGLTMIRPTENDGLVFNDELPLADKVLVDAPCSGLGVIRRKPEIKYKRMETVESLPPLQAALLDMSARYVKPGGRLIYSTCTLSKAENDGVCDTFLRAHPEFTPIISPSGVPEIPDATRLTFLPNYTGGDGFFMAAFIKKK
jgi:16S rRNA (cytosine967-C5)-methyltransferase